MTPKTVTIPVLCGLTGCWAHATVTGKDERGYTARGCNASHLKALLAHRHAEYMPHSPIAWAGTGGLEHKFDG